MKNEISLAVTIVAVILTVLYFFYRYMESNSSYKIISVILVDNILRDYVITLENAKGKVFQYRGSCTVWNDTVTGNRAGTAMEYMLSNIYTKHIWKEKEAMKKENK